MVHKEMRRFYWAKEKKRVREEMIQSLSKWDSSARKEISNQIQDQLFQSDLWRDTQTIGVYLSVGNEWDTRNCE